MLNDIISKEMVCTPMMKGSFSIKYVLPALVPDFGKAYKKALLEYCKLDTLAMVKILEVLKKVIA